MEFHATGLPVDPAVYRAFGLYNQYNKVAPSKAVPGHALRMAQLLTQYSATDSVLLSCALMQDIPDAASGIIEKRFGEDVVSLRQEIIQYKRESLAGISQASDRAKLFYLAFYAVGLKDIETIIDGGLIGEGATVYLPVPGTDNFKKFLSAVHMTTSCPELEARCQELSDKMESYQNGTSARQTMNPMFERFEETRLLDDSQVRTAYEIITNSARAHPNDVLFALMVGEILSTVPEFQNPATIAASLIDSAIRGLTDKEAEALEEKAGSDVVGILHNGSIYSPDLAAQLLNGSEEFKQVAIASAIASMGELQISVEMLLEESYGNPFLSKSEIRQELKGMREYIERLQEPIAAILGTSGSAQLEALFESTYRTTAELIVRSTPPSSPAPKPPNPPKPEF